MVAIIENKIKEFCDAGGICIFTTHQDTTLTTREISL
jgi:ABC-type transport system involved in cytochrome c biogenesis ATPase subunit